MKSTNVRTRWVSSTILLAPRPILTPRSAARLWSAAGAKPAIRQRQTLRWPLSQFARARKTFAACFPRAKSGFEPWPAARGMSMKSRWSDAEADAAIARYGAKGIAPDLALRVYTTRLLGGDPALVLHGGGNTSVKTQAKDLLGDTVDVI